VHGPNTSSGRGDARGRRTKDVGRGTLLVGVPTNLCRERQKRRNAVDEVNESDELGPVDWIVVEFPGSAFNGEIAPALGDLVERDLIRVLDLLLLKKDADGAVEAFELSDLDDSEVGALRGYEAELAMLLSEDDVTAVAAAIEPGSSAAVLVWENTWAVPFATAVRHSGGQLVASGRIPIQALLAAVEANDEFDAAELADAAKTGA
jgi:hypothetical protein